MISAIRTAFQPLNLLILNLVSLPGICFAQEKTQQLPSRQTTTLTFGGEVRYQYFYYNNQDWGEAPKDKDGFVLTRYLGHADLRTGKHVRAFVQLQSSLTGGQIKTPSPVDQNPLDLHEAFVDYSTNDKTFIIRAGRQELSYGSQRLVSVREAPNNRQAFDGLKMILKSANTKLDLFYSRYVIAKPNIFDDGLNRNTQFWGAYAVFNKVPVVANVDLYYLGIHKNSSTYNIGSGSETRHSIGARLWSDPASFQYDIEGLYQFGDFVANTISAWTLSANVSYTFEQATFKPQFGLKTEAISGDRHADDGRLNTFNPLFPKGGYFGLAALIGPSNLIDAHPYLQLSLAPKLEFNIDYDLFWRMNASDGIYAVNSKLIYPAIANGSKQIGRQLGLEIKYAVNKNLTLRQELTWFNAGDYLKQAGPGKDILMLGSTIVWRF